MGIFSLAKLPSRAQDYWYAKLLMLCSNIYFIRSIEFKPYTTKKSKGFIHSLPNNTLHNISNLKEVAICRLLLIYQDIVVLRAFWGLVAVLFGGRRELGQYRCC